MGLGSRVVPARELSPYDVLVDGLVPAVVAGVSRDGGQVVVTVRTLDVELDDDEFDFRDDAAHLRIVSATKFVP